MTLTSPTAKAIQAARNRNASAREILEIFYNAFPHKRPTSPIPKPTQIVLYEDEAIMLGFQ